MARIHKRRPMSEINVVPYIDVMLVLLIIFMITAPLIQQGVEVELPQAQANPVEDKDNPPLVVTVDRNGQYYLDVGESPTDPVSLQDIQVKVAAVLRNKPQTPVMVRGDQAVDYGAVVRVMTHLQGAGVPAVGLMTEPGS